MPEPEAVVDRVDALPSEDNGNVAVDDIKPAPSPEPTPAPAPAAPAEPATPPAEPVIEKFKLPDGREVTADELYREHTENLLPEFTRRSQELARLKGNPGGLPDNGPTQKPYENPDWAPKSYAELIEIAKQEVRGDFEAEERNRIETERAIESAVVSQLSEIKKIDPNLNENALFIHANKYHFTDLRLAFDNMREMSEAVKKVQKTTADNVARRSDPVSFKPGAGGGQGAGPSSFGNAVEYLRSLKH